MGRFHDPGLCQLYYVGVPNKVRINYTIRTSRLSLGNLGGVIPPTLFKSFIVHPGIIHKKYIYIYSSWYSPLKILFINSNTIIENTGTIHYSYRCQFLLIFLIYSHKGKIVEVQQVVIHDML